MEKLFKPRNCLEPEEKFKIYEGKVLQRKRIKFNALKRRVFTVQGQSLGEI